uniref:Uncharacterized protein n=1 Tax=Panagrolaimus sp. ES5 TaxID=591445 RepID=A0AC34FK36_9BILA
MKYFVVSLLLLCIVAAAFAKPLNNDKKPGEHSNDDEAEVKKPAKREATEDKNQHHLDGGDHGKPKREATDDKKNQHHIDESEHKPKREATEDKKNQHHLDGGDH